MKYIKAFTLFILLAHNVIFAQHDKSIIKFEQAKLQITMELKADFTAIYSDKKAYVEIIFASPNTYTNGALWTYNKKFHSLKEMIETQNKDTTFTQISKLEKIDINGMTAYFFEGTEKDEKNQEIISNRLIIDREGFDELYLIYLNQYFVEFWL